MVIECEVCGKILRHYQEWGDGYREPREYAFSCPVCGTEMSYVEGFGLAYDFDNTDEKWLRRAEKEEEDE